MREIQLEEIKQIELKLLEQVTEICERECFKYSLAYGTLLGAIRHNGFIPWDDDIDILMPRPDFIKLINYCNENETVFELVSLETSEKYCGLIAKATDLNTIIKEDILDNTIESGVYIDIFPIDGLGLDFKTAVKNFRSTTFSRELLTAAEWSKFLKSKTHPWYYEPIRFVFFILSRIINKHELARKINNKASKIGYEESKIVGSIFGSYREKEILDKGVYEEFIDADFEGKRFKILKHYHEYLSALYGDYMKLPPVEKQVSRHYFKAYLK